MPLIKLRKAIWMICVAGSMLLFFLFSGACSGGNTPNEVEGVVVSSEKVPISEPQPGSAIAKAKLAGHELKSLQQEASQFGLLILAGDIDEYKQIRERLLTNTALASAFRVARDNDVGIILYNKFEISERFVFVDIYSSDDEIIRFLLEDEKVN